MRRYVEVATWRAARDFRGIAAIATARFTREKSSPGARLIFEQRDRGRTENIRLNSKQWILSWHICLYCGRCTKIYEVIRKAYLHFLLVNYMSSTYSIRRVVRLGASHRRLSMPFASLSACANPPHEMLDCTSKQPSTTKVLTTRPPNQQGLSCCDQALEYQLPD